MSIFPLFAKHQVTQIDTSNIVFFRNPFTYSRLAGFSDFFLAFSTIVSFKHWSWSLKATFCSSCSPTRFWKGRQSLRTGALVCHMAPVSLWGLIFHVAGLRVPWNWAFSLVFWWYYWCRAQRDSNILVITMEHHHVKHGTSGSTTGVLKIRLLLCGSLAFDSLPQQALLEVLFAYCYFQLTLTVPLCRSSNQKIHFGMAWLHQSFGWTKNSAVRKLCNWGLCKAQKIGKQIKLRTQRTCWTVN